MFKAATMMVSSETDDLTKRLNKHMGEFDVLSLLRYLKYKGYSERNIRFVSHQSLVSQSHLIERIAVYVEHVVITLNLGLFGIQTPMPSEMLVKMSREHLESGDETGRLLSVLDHTLILNFLASVYPELNVNLFSRWEQTRQNLLLIQNVHSTAFLYWLFQRVFPEFVIRFDEKFIPRQVPTAPVTLNHFDLGGAATLGGIAMMSDLCVHINLQLELGHYRRQLSWVSEVEERLQTLVYPLLNQREIYLFISLELEHESQTRLAEDGRLGRDLLPANSPDVTEATLQYFILHQGGVLVPTPEAAYEIQWGDACRIRV